MKHIDSFKNMNIVEKFFNQINIEDNRIRDYKFTSRFFIKELYNSTLEDDFYKKLLELFLVLSGDSDLNKFEKNFKQIIDDKKSTYGHIIHYLFVFSEEKDRNFGKSEKITYEQVVKLIYKIFDEINYKIEQEDKPTYNRKRNVYDCEISKFYWKVISIRHEYIDAKRKKEEAEKRKHITITIKQLVKLIKKSTLHDILKDSIIGRLEDEDILSVVEENQVFCDMDACLEFYEESTGTSYYDENDKEKDDVEPYVINHFKNNLKDFPFDICTEDYITIYEKN